MKKLLLLTLILTPLFLAGCSVAPSTPAASTAPTSNPNNSIWMSVDSGITWENNYLIGKKVDISSVDVLSVAINPFDAKNVYVGLRGPGILKTEDGGQNWDYLNFQSQKVYGLDVDPTDGRVIYASGVWKERGKIFKSSDAGANWTEIYTTASNGPLVISLLIDKKNPNIVYATTSDNQVIKTTDGGTSWKNILVSDSPVLKVAIDRADDNLIYALTQQRGAIFKSRDGGKAFEDLSKQKDEDSQIIQDVAIIETDPGNSGWLYAAGKNGLFLSKNAGKSWEKIEILSNPQNFPVKAVAINPKNPKEIIYGAAQAAYRSLDGGVSWSTSQFNISKSINVIKYSNADPTNLYLGFSK